LKPRFVRAVVFFNEILGTPKVAEVVKTFGGPRVAEVVKTFGGPRVAEVVNGLLILTFVGKY